MTIATNQTPRPDTRFRSVFTPKLVSALREGYDLEKLRADAVAGLTVAIVALPLAMAIAIASGTTPDRGIYTAIVAGFIISAFGGSRYQIGGPTAAFIVVVFSVIERHGYEGLVLATIIAGIVLIIVGFLRLGTYIKYIPYPVVVGFTAGIAVSIFVSQLKEVLGLDVAMPGDFIEKMVVLAEHVGETRPAAVAVTLAALLLIVGLRRFRPRWPGFLIAVAVTSVGVALGQLDVATIATRFGDIPSTLPAPTLPRFDLALARAVMPDALTIALLAGIESLLSAVVADGMTGRRHRSNCELVAQGVANVASVIFGGLSATGAIARTATNIRAGARTPIAGIMHALFLVLFMAVAAPALAFVPLAALAAILLVVAWNISEAHHIRRIMTKASVGDRVVLTGTFLLTVAVDLTIGIGFGVVAAAILFMHRMAEAVEVETHVALIDRDVADTARTVDPNAGTPSDVVVYRIRGPFFFGAVERVSSVFNRIEAAPRAFVLDFSAVPFVDSTAGVALGSLVERAQRHGTTVILSGVAPAVQDALAKFGIAGASVHHAPDLATALVHLGPSSVPVSAR